MANGKWQMANGRAQTAGWLKEHLVDLVMAVIAVVLAVILANLLVGCAGTVTPRIVTQQVASWDGTNQNSGFVGFLADGAGVLTAHGRDRYNALVPLYRTKFLPPLNVDDGLSAAPIGADVFIKHKRVGAVPAGSWRIDQQHLSYYGDMNRWRKQGI